MVHLVIHRVDEQRIADIQRVDGEQEEDALI